MIIIHWTHCLFWLAESVQWIFEISACDAITADYTIIMSRTLKVTGNHVWLRCMISKGNHVKFMWFVVLAVSEEAKTWLFFFIQCIIKQLLDSVFVISRIIKVSVRVVVITPTLTLIILDITKTSSTNCLLSQTQLQQELLCPHISVLTETLKTSCFVMQGWWKRKKNNDLIVLWWCWNWINSGTTHI